MNRDRERSTDRTGTLGQRYADERRKAAAVGWRYRARAWAAVQAYSEFVQAATTPVVLEMGAADGRTLLEVRRLLGEAGRYDGVELAEALIAAAPPLPADTKLIRGDVTKLTGEGLAPCGYTLVLALALLEHLADPLSCTREAFRVLQPGGVFVASCPAPAWDGLAGHLRLVEADAHQQRLDRRALEGLLHGAGFEQIGSRPFMWAPTGALSYLHLPVPQRLASRLDRVIGGWPLLQLGFVNQLAFGRKPAGP